MQLLAEFIRMGLHEAREKGFQQIVNLDCIHAFNAVNLRMGYPILEIRSPREITHGEKI